MKKLLHALACIFTPLLLLGQTVPSQVNYQGQLLDSAGTPLPNGEYTLTMSLYDAATSGALVWGPQIFDGLGLIGHGPRVPVVGGYFNLILSTDTNGVAIVEAFKGAPRYLEIRVGSNPAISPRQQILSAPFALNSDKLGGTNWSAVFDTGNPATGKIPGGRIANASITGTQIATNAITYSKIADGAVGRGKLGSEAVSSPSVIQDDVITSSAIADGTIMPWDIGQLNFLTRDGSTTKAVFVNTSGEVGIRTTLPSGPLTVVGFRTDPATLYTPSRVTVGGADSTLKLETGIVYDQYDPNPPNPDIVFTITGDGYAPYYARIRLDPYPWNRFSITNAGLSIQNGLYVTNMPTTVVGTTYYVMWDSSTRQYIRGASSSLRYKENVQRLQEDPYRILKLEPKKYTRRDGSRKWEVGYIAEDLDEVGLRELTMYDEEGRPDAIDYAKIVLYSNEIIKDQQRRLNTQQEQIDSLRNQLEELRRMVSGLKQDRQ